MQYLHDTHREMLDLVDAHEHQTAQDAPNILELTRLRLEMMKVHRRRLAQFDRIALAGDRLPTGTRGHIERFRQEDVEITALVSQHVREWPTDRIVREWNDYRAAAVHNYAWHRDRVAREEDAFGF